MKTQSTAIASVLCTLFAGFAVTEAGTETIAVPIAEEEGCLAPLTIALEWDDDTDLDLYVVEPFGGDKVNYNNRVGTFGYLDQDRFSGVETGPEQYIVYGGLSTSSSSTSPSSTSSIGDVRGEYWVIVNSFNGGYVPFTLTATTGSGNVILDVEDAFDTDCDGEELSHFFRVYLGEYVDTGCVIPDLDAIAVEGDEHSKEQSKGNRKK